MLFRSAHEVFEPAQPVADCTLRHAEIFRSRGHTAEAVHGLEGDQGVEWWLRRHAGSIKEIHVQLNSLRGHSRLPPCMVLCDAWSTA